MQTASERRARRAAKRVGLVGRKSRWRRGTCDDRGGFILINTYTNGLVDGVRFDLSPERVIEICENREHPYPESSMNSLALYSLEHSCGLRG
jgi:hypothetical protein